MPASAPPDKNTTFTLGSATSSVTTGFLERYIFEYDAD
jgi:hypothetical protein